MKERHAARASVLLEARLGDEAARVILTNLSSCGCAVCPDRVVAAWPRLSPDGRLTVLTVMEAFLADQS